MPTASLMEMRWMMEAERLPRCMLTIADTV